MTDVSPRMNRDQEDEILVLEKNLVNIVCMF